MNEKLKLGDKVNILYENNLHLSLMTSLGYLKNFLDLAEAHEAKVISISPPLLYKVEIINYHKSLWFSESNLEKVFSNNK